jgi:hypothetical protein
MMLGGNNRYQKYVDFIFQSRGKNPKLDPHNLYDYARDTAMFRKQGCLFQENRSKAGERDRVQDGRCCGRDEQL